MKAFTEITPSGNSKCTECGKIITKGSKRMATYTGHFNSFKYTCQKCGIKVLTDLLNKLS